MKKIFFTIALATLGLHASASTPDDNFLDIAYCVIITECGKEVKIPAKDYTVEEIEQMIDDYTKEFCKDANNGPLNN